MEGHDGRLEVSLDRKEVAPGSADSDWRLFC